MREKTRDKNQKDKIKITGVVKNIIFRDQDSGYTVFKIKVCENNNQNKISYQDNYFEIMCNGYFAELAENEKINITGYFFVHPSYGEQFKVLSIEKKVTLTEINIKKYLSSGLIKGIGPKMAERIINMFSINTFDVINNNPESLTKISGISKQMAENINKTFLELENNDIQKRDIYIYLQSLDITPSYINKIQKRYGDDAINLLKINPYRLTDEISGIGFKKADLIAENMGIKKDSDFRIQSAIKFCLKQAAESNGHVYLPKDILLDDAYNLININKNLILANIDHMQKNNLIKQVNLNKQDVIYLNYYYHMEEYIAKKILLLNKAANQIKSDQIKDINKNINIKAQDKKNKSKININIELSDINSLIKKISSQKNILLDDHQVKAIQEAIKNGITIITGGPGTGKTTALKFIINILKSFGFCLELCAPTGRAAKKMSEATSYDAKTIHRLLGINFSGDNNNNNKNNNIEFQKFNCDENNPIKADYIIVDEASMIDIFLMYSLLKAISLGTKLILVGDVDQLPSVGPGSILKDFINSSKIKTINLNKIFRQAAQSSIVINAHKINNGEKLDLSKPDNDFFVISKSNTQDIIKIILELALNRIPKKLALNNNNNNNNNCDTQILCPMKRGDLGTINLNKILQEKLNPPDKSKAEKLFNNNYVFREGDKIMQVKNNYSLKWDIVNKNNICISNGLGVFNGDTGYILNINHNSKKVLIRFDDNKLVEYDFSQLDEIDLAYAITIHKSQGSEYKSVIIPIFSGPPIFMNKNLLYTAVTRAKNLAILIGSTKTIYSMIKNKKQLDRFSNLSQKIKELYKSI